MFLPRIMGLASLMGILAAHNNDAWNGVVYHATSSPQYTTAMAILQDVQFAGDEHILDIRPLSKLILELIVVDA